MVELERLAAGRLARLEPRQGQEVIDQPGHTRAFLLHRRQRCLKGLRVDHLAPAEHVDIAGDRRQWRAQLVRGIGDEVAHLFLRLPADFEGLVDAGSHLVERDRQRSDLVTGLRHADPLLVIPGRKGPGRGGHLLERAQRPADDQRAQQQGKQQHQQRSHDGDLTVQPQRLIDLAGGNGELRQPDRPGTVADHVEHHEVVRAVGRRRHVIRSGRMEHGVAVFLGGEARRVLCGKECRRGRCHPTAVDVDDGGRCAPGAQLEAERLRQDERPQRGSRPGRVLPPEGVEDGVVLADEHVGVGSKEDFARGEVLGDAGSQQQDGEQAEVDKRQPPSQRAEARHD